MRRIAIIDLGTNSVRFDVHALGMQGRRETLHREKLMVRLGENAFRTGRLDARAMARTLAAMKYFARVCRELQVDHVIAFATSAIRDSSNGAGFVSRVKRATGIRIEVISGEQEAKLIAVGVLNRETPPESRFALIDIGGGSTEIIVCDGNRILNSGSFKLGTARLQELYLRSSPPSADAVEAMRKEIRSVLYGRILAERWSHVGPGRDKRDGPKVKLVLGSSGTAKAYLRMIRRSGKGRSEREVSRKKLGQWVDRLSRMPLDQILKLPGLEAKRADMILAGGVLLEECMDVLGVKRMRPTDFSLRDGILDAEVMSLMQRGRREPELVSPSVLRARLRARAPREWMRHAEKVADHVLRLEQQLPRRLRLTTVDKKRLELAAYLHDIGRWVNSARHGTHGFYMIENFDGLGGRAEDREWIARLCLHHADEKIDLKALGAWSSQAERLRFARSLALLQVADALDRTRFAAPRTLRLSASPRGRGMMLRARGLGDVERLRLEQKKSWWEWAFKTSLVFQKTNP